MKIHYKNREDQRIEYEKLFGKVKIVQNTKKQTSTLGNRLKSYIPKISMRKIITTSFMYLKIIFSSGIEYIKGILFFVLNIALFWLFLWIVNIIEWGTSISLGSIINSLLLTGGPENNYTVYHFICELISTLPFAASYGTCAVLFSKVKPVYYRSFLYILFALLVIILIDPHVSYYLPLSLQEIAYVLHNDYHFRMVGGPNLWNYKLSEEITYMQYTIFDIVVIVMAVRVCFLEQDSQ